MEHPKKSAGQIVPEKENLDQYPDEVKSPLHQLKDTMTVREEAEESFDQD